jgi:hypothetical protein
MFCFYLTSYFVATLNQYFDWVVLHYELWNKSSQLLQSHLLIKTISSLNEIQLNLKNHFFQLTTFAISLITEFGHLAA